MKAAIVKLSSAGDIVQALPAAHYLKAQGAHVTWIVDARFADLVTGVDEVVALPLKPFSWKALGLLRNLDFDVLYDLQGNCKSGLVTALIAAHKKVGFGRKTVAEWPALLATHEHRDPAPGRNIRADYLAMVGGRFTPSVAKPRCVRRIAIAPGSRWKNKELPLASWEQIIEAIERQHAIEWVFTSGSEREYAISSHLAKQVKRGEHRHGMTLQELRALLDTADLVIAVDSLPLHVTSAPSIGIFGASSGAKYAPQHFVQGHCPYQVTFDKRCPRLRTCRTGACMESFSLHEIIGQILAKL